LPAADDPTASPDVPKASPGGDLAAPSPASARPRSSHGASDDPFADWLAEPAPRSPSTTGSSSTHEQHGSDGSSTTSASSEFSEYDDNRDDSRGYRLQRPGGDTEPIREIARRPLRGSAERHSIADAVRSLPPLTMKTPPLWLRHLHWLLVIGLIPLAVSLLFPDPPKTLETRLEETLADVDEERQIQIMFAMATTEDVSIDQLFQMLPERKFKGAWLPRDTWAHWWLTLLASGLFFGFFVALCKEGSAEPLHLLLIGLFTAVIGVFLLLIIQRIAFAFQGVVVMPTNIIGLFLLIFKFIEFSYSAALNPDNGFLASFFGFTMGVGLLEEVVKALPLLFAYRHARNQSWLGAYLWGLASGAGFGLSEGVTYASDYYNGISGGGIYLVRFISCVSLHALFTGSVAISIHQNQESFQNDCEWYNWIGNTLYVIAIPMILHGLYDTLLKKDMNALALVVAVLSFLYLAFQISRLRGADDHDARRQMLREYKRRRDALAGA